MANEPTSLQDAIIYFADPTNRREYVTARRWPNGVSCPTCASTTVNFLAKQERWECRNKHPKRQFSMKTGTIYEDSPLGIDKWLTATWLVVNCKNGVSSCEVARALNITQKSAWFMVRRIRVSLGMSTPDKLTGEVEADETFIGGKARNMHITVRKRRITGLSYEGLATDYAHQVVDQAVQYVDGKIHTNGLENFWSLLKRGISGTYISIEPFHLFRYLDEQAFRYNHCKNMNDADRFNIAIRQIVGKRLTYDQLTGKAVAGLSL
jgi:transposase-like protein